MCRDRVMTSRGAPPDTRVGTLTVARAPADWVTGCPQTPV
jgi:hypothetical protein